MKSDELLELTKDETLIRLRDAREELENLRFQHSMRQLENPFRIRSVKREIAQLNTILREESLGIRTLRGTGTDDTHVSEEKEK